MLTIHAATLTPVAVAVRGDLVEAVGPRDELVARHPAARVRDWPGSLGPARVHTGPLPPAPSPREQVHAVLRLGATAVLAEHLRDPALRAAVARGGLQVLDAPPPAAALVPFVRADLAVFGADGSCLATVLAGRVVHRRA